MDFILTMLSCVSSAAIKIPFSLELLVSVGFLICIFNSMTVLAPVLIVNMLPFGIYFVRVRLFKRKMHCFF